jgi:hypothetical protein
LNDALQAMKFRVLPGSSERPEREAPEGIEAGDLENLIGPVGTGSGPATE